MTSTVDPSAVTWTPPAEVTWHDDILINGEPYPTRNHAPDYGPNSDAYLGSLTYAQRDVMRAVHEAAHAVAVLSGGGYVHDVTTSTTAALRSHEPTAHGVASGATRVCNLTDMTFAAFFGAGERAEDRWLRENGLWTSTLAAGVELGAYGDRKTLLRSNPHVGFGAGQDYVIVHDLADHVLDEHWLRVFAVAGELVTRLRLDGDEVADLAGLPNGTHSPTCDFN
ncbi:hypothetical protein ACFV16_22320 [Streptomyces massasporeus]|uniref:hypothetical protein n=1 Tax=Streptomyces massasporeus TaxID=67324 RepID=UPI0036C229A3